MLQKPCSTVNPGPRGLDSGKLPVDDPFDDPSGSPHLDDPRLAALLRDVAVKDEFWRYLKPRSYGEDRIVGYQISFKIVVSDEPRVGGPVRAA
jgi:hypothetical protein